MTNTWVLGEDGVHLRGDAVPNAPISSLEIYDAEFEGLGVVRGLAVSRPSIDIPDLQFSPSAARHQFHLEIETDSIVLRISVESLRLDSWPAADHMVVGAKWYALHWDAINEQHKALADRGIDLGHALNHQDVLWLLGNAEIDIEAAGLPEDLATALTSASSGIFDPTLLRATLYPYQIVGGLFLSRVSQLGLGALLADEMGLGKTMQALYLLAAGRARSHRPGLVIAPSSTLANWQRELERFAPTLSVHLHRGPRRTGDPRVLSAAAVVLTSFDVLVRDQELLRQIAWETVVLDEAQSIKNAVSQRSQAAKTLTRNSGVAITGTPIENSLRDMWSIFEFVAPDTLGTIELFVLQYPDEIAAAKALSRRVAPLVLRRTVDQVADDLPARIDAAVPIFVSDRLAELYESIRVAPGQLPIVALTRLRQACASPKLVDEHWGSIVNDFPKMDRLIEILDEVVEVEAKALVFASFTQSIDEIHSVLEKRYPGAYIESIDGRRNPDGRQDIIDQFSEHSGPGVLVMNPKAAGVGLNIQAANHVIHFTPEWNPAIVAQASARSHRRGQTRPVFVYYLYYVDTVEEVMMSRLDAKRELQQAGLSEITSDPTATDVAAALKLTPTR